MNKLTIEQVQDFIEDARPAELMQLVGHSYLALLRRVVEGKANGEELAGLKAALSSGWSVRLYHSLAQGTLSAELAREDGETSALFEHDPNAGTRH